MQKMKRYILLVEMMDDNFEITMDGHNKNELANDIRNLYRDHNIFTNYYHVDPREIYTDTEIMDILIYIGYLQELVNQTSISKNSKLYISPSSHVNRMLEFLSGYFEGKTLNSGEYKNPPLPPRMY